MAAAENMRYDESLKSPLIKPEKTILHPGEVQQPDHLSASRYIMGQAAALLMPQLISLHPGTQDLLTCSSYRRAS